MSKEGDSSANRTVTLASIGSMGRVPKRTPSNRQKAWAEFSRGSLLPVMSTSRSALLTSARDRTQKAAQIHRVELLQAGLQSAVLLRQDEDRER